MSGTAIRIIPCLDVAGGRVVKGVRFLDLEDSGDPAELASRYESEGADELAILDISATIEGRDTALEALRRIRDALGIPILMGGGVRNDADAARLLEAGADRVAVNSAACRDPAMIDRLAARFGVQCVVLAIDARSRAAHGAAAAHGSVAAQGSVAAHVAIGWEVVVEAGRRDTGREAAAWAREGASRGAGEILLTSIDRDGTGSGYDAALVAAVAAASGLPVVASGGASEREHFLEGARAGARALLAAGVFHRGELSIADLKRYLAEKGLEVRI